MSIWHDVDSKRITPEKFLACIEIPQGVKNKYELDKETGALILDRVLYTSTHYPHNYGFIPKTLAEDGDPLDVLVICSGESIVPLSLVTCRPLGVLEMIDNGFKDLKIIAVADVDPVYAEYNEVKDLPSHLLAEIRHFFMVYKQLEHKKTVVHRIKNKASASKAIQDAINLYNEKFPK